MVGTGGARRLVAVGAGALMVISGLAMSSAGPAVGASASTPPAGVTLAAPAPQCTITGTPDADVLRGTPQDDVICGRGGNDVIRGGGGDDLLIGGAGRDLLLGGAGDDALDGGMRRDTLVGGPGDDTCEVSDEDVPSRDCAVDSSGPTITDVQVPATVAAGTQITVAWRVTDPSTVTGSYLLVRSETWNSQGRQGWVSWCFGASARLVSGDERDGVYAVTCEVPANVINDTFTVWVGAHDALGNGTWPEGTTSFATVGGSDDRDPPTVSDVMFASTVRPGDVLSIAVRAQDVSGVASIGFLLRGGEPQFASIWGAGPMETISGDARDGVFRVDVEIPPGVSPGSYDVWLFASDEVGNAWYSSFGTYGPVAIE